MHHGRQPDSTIALVAPHLDAEAEAAEIYLEQSTQTQGIRAMPGAVELFHSMPPERTAIVTAARVDILRWKLQLVGIAPPQFFVTSDMVKAGKPDPEGYLAAARQIGVAPAECLVFEDAPAGLLAADRAGMRSIAVLSNYSEAQLREELGPDVQPLAFVPDLRCVRYAQGRLHLSHQGRVVSL